MNDRMKLSRAHPRLFAGLCFALAECILALILVISFLIPAGQMRAGNAMIFLSLQALAGLAAGALLGKQIIVQPMNGFRAACWGITSSITAFLFSIILMHLFEAYRPGGLWKPGIYVPTFFGIWIPLVLVGALAGWLLRRIAEK